MRALDQLADRMRDEPADEVHQHETDEHDLDNRPYEDAELESLDLSIDRFQAERDIEDAQDLHGRGMGVAGGLAAGRLIINGSDHGQAAAAVREAVDPNPAGKVDSIPG